MTETDPIFRAGDRGVDAVVVGAGFAGLYMLKRLRGMGLEVQVIEAGSGVGGTWFWNRYPGARCDIESMEYSYGFSDDLQQKWEWTEKFATQPEILSYLDHVADEFDLRGDIRFDTRVEHAHFDESASRWRVATDRGDSIDAQFLIMATGCLSSASTPTIDGIDSFGGQTHHTGEWPHDGVDVSGKRVGVIGTGSSGVQAIPLLAEDASHLTVFQRTATYVTPARNKPLDPAYIDDIKGDYPAFRAANELQTPAFGSRRPNGTESVHAVSEEDRRAEFQRRWDYGGLGFVAAYVDLLIDETANGYAAEFVRSKIRETVDDPATAELLCPDQPIGCKRLCLGTDYYETYNRTNVDLVDVSEGITAITPKGVLVGDTEYELDTLVFATGFDAMTGALLSIDVQGIGGTTLREAWAAGPITYLGLGVSGFPNMFTISGPGSPSVLTNMVVSIEQHVRWISDAIAYLAANGHERIEAEAEAADEWVAYVNAVAGFTLFPTCNSWYLGANVPGKPRVFMPLPGYPGYVVKCDEVAANDYEGFALT